MHRTDLGPCDSQKWVSESCSAGVSWWSQGAAHVINRAEMNIFRQYKGTRSILTVKSIFGSMCPYCLTLGCRSTLTLLGPAAQAIEEVVDDLRLSAGGFPAFKFNGAVMLSLS